jgi:glutamine amidotransferase
VIAIVDYGMGNLKSVEKALEKIGASCQVTANENEILSAEKVIVPGVGAFGDAMTELSERKLIEPLKLLAKRNTPVLGICLGLQIMFETSEENRGVNGLGIIPGEVKRFSFPPDSALRIPHIGWNTVAFKKESPLFSGIPSGSFFYFVHSFYCSPKNSDVVISETDYGNRFVSSVNSNRLFGVQFHPEKSQDYGLKLLKNFVAL